MTGQDIYNELIRLGVSPEDAKILTAVAYVESCGFKSWIVGDKHLGGSVGLFQIHLPSHKDKLIRATGSTNRDDWVAWLQDPWNNIKMAAEIYKSQGLKAWTVYKKETYKPYVGRVEGRPVKMLDISTSPGKRSEKPGTMLIPSASEDPAFVETRIEQIQAKEPDTFEWFGIPVASLATALLGLAIVVVALLKLLPSRLLRGGEA